MPDLKLSKLPDRNSVKITIIVRPDLHAALQAYAALYRESYGEDETVAELIPYMLQTFLESDRSFAKAMRGRDGSTSNPPRPRRRTNPSEAYDKT
ncbi:MAG: DUF2274 domain-containing protein [Alphaproteobacteria bacterium]|nr:DUF2274 domain-containing protein [Alphaproteobacteria bacterium]